MIAIDCSKELVDMEGKVLSTKNGAVEEKLLAGKAIANVILMGKSKGFDPFKNWKVAQEFYKSEQVKIDEADFNVIRSCIESSGREVFSDIVLGQLIELLDQCKEESKRVAQ